MKRSNFRLVAAGTLGLFCLARAAAGQASHENLDNPTAYTALRLVGKTLGSDAINHVVEVSGREGKPQPSTWKIVLAEGAGGKEVEVVNGKITTQTPVAHPVGGAPINLQDLNLDSSGAFDATDTQARKVRVRFDSINYMLRTSEKSGKPVWALELFNESGVSAGTMRIAAKTGAIASMAGRIATTSTAPASKPAAPVKPAVTSAPPAPRSTPALVAVDRSTPRPVATAPATTTVTTVTTVPAPTAVVDVPDAGAPPVAPTPDDRGGFFTRTGRTLDHTSRNVNHSLDRAGHDVDHSLRRAGATIQRFFTGHSDLDSDVRPVPAPAVGQPD